MDWIKTVVSIKEKLAIHGFHDTVVKLTEAQMVLGTPGEMYLEVMHELMMLKNRSPVEYQLIEEEVTALVNYGKSINFFNPGG
ncbi:MAG: hypothetical protein M3Y60_10955 [Bacteroidota bacterium]|nr:hypothetical protein [Bacteroidota bacterium]